MHVVAWALIVGAVVFHLVAIGGYASALRSGHYDAIATSTLFDGRWIGASLLLGITLTLQQHWPLYAAALFVLGGFVTALPVKALVRLVAARR